jgi:phosphate uptake regulator
METIRKDDIVPDLYDQMMKRFRSSVAMDPWVKAFSKRLKAGKATQEEAQNYAGRIGKHAASALSSSLRAENLPDGRIYWNIAKRTIEPLLREATEMVNDAMVSIIEAEHKKKRIGMKPIRAGFNQDRCDAIMNRTVNLSFEAEDVNA